MRTSDILSVAVVTATGLAAGLFAAGPFIAIVLGAVAGALAYSGSKANMRPGVVSTVLIATIAGGFIGSQVVEAICLPQTCTALQLVGAVTSALVMFVGVGLVTALVARSFDEYNEREAAGLPPTGVGCEVPEVESSTPPSESQS